MARGASGLPVRVEIGRLRVPDGGRTVPVRGGFRPGRGGLEPERRLMVVGVIDPPDGEAILGNVGTLLAKSVRGGERGEA